MNLDLKSLMGYRADSPYRHLPYIDISTPEGLIDMSKTPIDLIGIDMKTGKQKRMKAFSKNPYKFDSDEVREIPIAQLGMVSQMSKNIGPSFMNFGVRENTQMPIINSSVDPNRLSNPSRFQGLFPNINDLTYNINSPESFPEYAEDDDRFAIMDKIRNENPIKHIDTLPRPTIQNSKIDPSRITDPFAPKQQKKFDPYFMLRGLTTGASWLAGRAARNRQDQYWQNQSSTLGQLTPANLEDYQPTPFNQYFQRGGLANKYKTFLTDWNNSPMGQQMLNASVLKDNPVGPDFKNADNIRNARNILINNADVNINKFKNYKKQLIKDFSPDDEDVKSTTGNSGIAGYYTPSDKDGIMSSITTDESSNLGTFRNPYIRYSGKNLPYAYAATIKPDIKTRIETHNHPSKRISDIEDTLIHELSHASDYGGFFMPLSDISKITDYAYYNREFPSGKPFMSIRPKKRLGEFQKYVADPTETRARLNSFRLAAKEQGIYDPFTQKITDLQLKRYKSSNEGYDPLQQLRTVYTDEQIIDLLNSVSKNDQVIDSVSEQAKYGGSALLKFQEGGPKKPIPRPTSSDSAKLYNSQIALNKFYENEVKAGRLKKIANSDFYDFYGPLASLMDENLDFYRKEIKRRKTITKGTWDEQYKNYFNLSPEQVSKLEYEGLGKTKSGNEYQQYYRDLITPLQNLASPFALVDSRIKPQRVISYGQSSETYPGGTVEVYDYDPLRIKPYYMRTPLERIKWENKYGKPENGTIINSRAWRNGKPYFDNSFTGKPILGRFEEEPSLKKLPFIPAEKIPFSVLSEQSGIQNYMPSMPKEDWQYRVEYEENGKPMHRMFPSQKMGEDFQKLIPGNRTGSWQKMQDGGEKREITYIHQPGWSVFTGSPTDKYMLKRTKTPYTSRRDIKRFTKQPTSPEDVNFISNYKGAIGEVDQYPTSVPFEGDKHWNIDRFIIEPQFGSFSYSDSEQGIPKDNINEMKNNTLADMYKYYMLQNNGNRGKSFRQAKRFIRKEINPRINGSFYKDFYSNKDEVLPISASLDNYADNNPLLGFFLNADVEGNNYNKDKWNRDKIRDVSIDYLRNYRKMSRKDSNKQFDVWNTEYINYLNSFITDYEKAPEDLKISLKDDYEKFKAALNQRKYGGSTLLKFQDGGSIVDFLKSRGIDSSKNYRRELAKQLGIENYDLSAEKNIEMLEYLRNNLSGPSMPFPTRPRKTISKPQSIDRTLLHNDYIPIGVLESSRNTIPSVPRGIPNRVREVSQHVPFGMNESDRNPISQRPVGIPQTGKSPAQKQTSPIKESTNNPFKGTSLQISKKPLDITPFYDNYKEIQASIGAKNEGISKELIPFIQKMASTNNGKFLITDKGKKKTYIGKVDKYGNINIEKEFEVLTGAQDDPNLALANNEIFDRQSKIIHDFKTPTRLVTPMGAFKLRRKNDIYGQPGAYLGKSSYAYHQTYPAEFQKRDPLYYDGNTGNNSITWGCINCKENDVNTLHKFPIDSTYVIDTRLPYEENVKQLSRKLFNKGGIKKGDELEVSDVELERLRRLGYKFNIL